MTEEEIAAGKYPCDVQKWRFAWQGEHTEEVQAAFIKESLRIFMEKPFVLGATYYNWRDAKDCWQCRKPDCPAETAWGMLDKNGETKLAYLAIQAASLAMV